MLVFYHRRPLELDTDGIWCVLPASFPENFQVHLRKMWGMEKNRKNAFKCNLKELTTKKAYSASSPRSVTMHLPVVHYIFHVIHDQWHVEFPLSSIILS